MRTPNAWDTYLVTCPMAQVLTRTKGEARCVARALSLTYRVAFLHKAGKSGHYEQVQTWEEGKRTDAPPFERIKRTIHGSPAFTIEALGTQMDRAMRKRNEFLLPQDQ